VDGGAEAGHLEEYDSTPWGSKGAVLRRHRSPFSSHGLTTTSALDPNQVIDQVFDFAEKTLEVQREFAKNLASTAAAAGETTRQQAEAAMKRCKTRPSSQGPKASEALRRRHPTPT